MSTWLPQSGYTPNLYFDPPWPREVPSYHFSKDQIEVYDPVWGKETLGNDKNEEVLLRLLANPLMVRLMTIEQLCTDGLTVTIPGGASFSRYEHSVGSAVLAKKLMQKAPIDFSEEETIINISRAMTHDAGQTMYSHLGDFLFEGKGAGESMHDDELEYLLEVMGVDKIFSNHDIDLKNILYPENHDWVERPSPDLCNDRVDFGPRQILRCFDLDPRIHNACSIDAFSLTEDGRLVMRSYQDAVNLSKAYMLLATEHWGEPVHRMQLHLMEELVKYILTSEDVDLGPNDSEFNGIRPYHPRDYLYSVNNDLTMQMRLRNPFITIVRQIMEENIALPKRRIFSDERFSQLEYFFSDYNKDMHYPNPLEAYSDKKYIKNLPLSPPNLSLIAVETEVDVSDFQQRDDCVDVFLPPLKNRFIDPEFYDENGEIKRLSDHDTDYKRLLKEQKEVTNQAYIGRLHLNFETKKIIQNGINEANKKWQVALTKPRMEPEKIKAVITDSSLLAYGGRLMRTSGIMNYEAI